MFSSKKLLFYLPVFLSWLFLAPIALAGDDMESGILAEDRIEINGATKEQLLNLGVLTPAQVDMILEFRSGMGDFMNFEELLDAGLDQESVDKLSPYITINFLTTECSC